MKNSIHKNICVIICFISAFILSGCNTERNIKSNYTENISIVCTTFPQYDWTCNIIGSTPGVDVSLLLDSGVESHSYQATADDIIRITNSDIFIYNGGQSDLSFQKIAEQNQRDDWNVINMMDELTDSLLHEEHSADDGHSHHDEIIYDEHIWLSLNNSVKLCEIITNKIIEVDPKNEEIYRKNSEKYIQSLKDLDKEYNQVIEKSKRKEFVLVDRHPFRYLTNDYDLICYAAFPGCSSEKDASFNTVILLGQKINELQCSCIAVTEKGNTSVLDAVMSVSNEDNITVSTLNSMQSVSEDDIRSGLTYISAMEQNLSALNSLLN